MGFSAERFVWRFNFKTSQTVRLITFQTRPFFSRATRPTFRGVIKRIYTLVIFKYEKHRATYARLMNLPVKLKT